MSHWDRYQQVDKVRIRRARSDEFPFVLDIARSLNEWFTEAGVRHIEQDLEFQAALLAEASGEIVGFLSYFIYDGIGQIGWMGISKQHHRSGIGTVLFEHFEQDMKSREVGTLQVYTLGDGVDYMPYERTRAFYRKMGFKDYRIETTDDPECPESLTLRKSITGSGGG